MSNDDGHVWIEGYERCSRCAMKRSTYHDLKRASIAQPERADLKEWLKCKEV